MKRIAIMLIGMLTSILVRVFPGTDKEKRKEGEYHS